MPNVTLQTKVSLLLILPLVFISIANGILLYLAGQPRMVLAGILILLGVLVAAKLFIQEPVLRSLKKLSELGNKCDTIEYSSKLLLHELDRSLLTQNDLVCIKRDLAHLKATIPNVDDSKLPQDLKNLLILTLQEAEKAGTNGKGHILIAKEIAKLCTEVKTSLQNIKGKIDDVTKLTTHLDEKLGNLQLMSETDKSALIAEGIAAQARRLYSSLPDFDINEKKTELEGRAPFETAVIRKAIRKKAA